MLCRLVILNVLFACVSTAFAAEPVATIPDSDFDRLHSIIKPQQGESRWREIDWFTNVTAAREKAATEGKPIVVFTAADGSPLGRT